MIGLVRYLQIRLGQILAKSAKRAKIKNHPISTDARTQKVKPGMVRLIPASKPRELDPFQHLGVRQHPLQPLGRHLEGWIFFVVPKHHPHSTSDHETGHFGSGPTRFFGFFGSKMTKKCII